MTGGWETRENGEQMESQIELCDRLTTGVSSSVFGTTSHFSTSLHQFPASVQEVMEISQKIMEMFVGKQGNGIKIHYLLRLGTSECLNGSVSAPF